MERCFPAVCNVAVCECKPVCIVVKPKVRDEYSYLPKERIDSEQPESR